MSTYTVIGIWDHEGQDDTNLIIAGVIEGHHPCVDSQSDVGKRGVYTRYATMVEADSPEEAERLVLADPS